jgi:hypothetical protein
VPLRLVYLVKATVSPACRAFSATTPLAAKAGKQSCSVAPWPTDVSDRPECMTALTDPRHHCPSVLHGSIPTVGEAARYGPGAYGRVRRRPAPCPKGPASAGQPQCDRTTLRQFSGGSVYRLSGPASCSAMALSRRAFGSASSLGPAQEERSAGCSGSTACELSVPYSRSAMTRARRPMAVPGP